MYISSPTNTIILLNNGDRINDMFQLLTLHLTQKGRGRGRAGGGIVFLRKLLNDLQRARLQNEEF